MNDCGKDLTAEAGSYVAKASPELTELLRVKS